MKDFSRIIDQIMPEVRDGAMEPFLIYRDEGGWNCVRKQSEEQAAAIRGKDPLAAEYCGKDFASGSYAHVYESVLCGRLSAECGENGTDTQKALIAFFKENACAFSDSTMDFIANCEKPLLTLSECCRTDLRTNEPGWGYDWVLADRAVTRIEDAVALILEGPFKRQPPEKRTISGYEEMMAVEINHRLVFLGENPAAEERYLVGEYRWDNPFGALMPEWVGVTNDFLEGLEKFNSITEYNIEVAKSRREMNQSFYGVEQVTLTQEHCVPGGLDEDLKGKLIIIKAEVLSPEFRYADSQLRVCVGGFGANPESRGNAIFCKSLFPEGETRFERYDVLGVADMGKMPPWVATVMERNKIEVAQSVTASVERPKAEKEAVRAKINRLKAEQKTKGGDVSRAKKPKKDKNER